MVNLHFIPSLRRIARNRVSAIFSCNSEIVSEIKANIRNIQLTGIYILDTLIIQSSIDRLITTLQPIFLRIGEEQELPKHLKEEILSMAMRFAIAFNCLKFANIGCSFYDILVEYYHLVCWEDFCEIDEQQTLEKVVLFYLQDYRLEENDRTISNQVSPWILLYLACYYCAIESIELMVSHIRELNLPIHHFPQEKMNSRITQYFVDRFMFRTKNNTSFKDLYRYSILNLNFPAMKYFFNFITEEEKNELFSLVQRLISRLPFFNYNRQKYYLPKVTVFLISNLNIDQQKIIFQKYRREIVVFFFHSLRKESFLNIFEIISNYSSLREVYNLLRMIAVKRDQTYFQYSDIFKAVFEKCSIQWKNAIIEETLLRQRYGFRNDLLSLLMQNNNLKCINLLVLYASNDQKLEIEGIVSRLSVQRNG